MSIETKKFDDATEAMNYLEGLALSKIRYIFRGHSDVHWRLNTTLSRHIINKFKGEDSSTVTLGEDSTTILNKMIRHFKAGLIKLGNTSFESNNNLDWLEYARHHYLPTPCIDFTYSPYVSLFFAFNGLKIDSFKFSILKDFNKDTFNCNDSDNCNYKDCNYIVVYAIAIAGLIDVLVEHFISNPPHPTPNPQGEREFLKMCSDLDIREKMRKEFVVPPDPLDKDYDPFTNGFLKGKMLFIPSPGKYNPRMQRQFGAFLYDTLDYQGIVRYNSKNSDDIGYEDLEDFIDKYKEDSKYPILIKVLISKKCVADVFKRLSLMGINGAMLFMNAEGVAMDVINSRYYQSMTNVLRGI